MYMDKKKDAMKDNFYVGAFFQTCKVSIHMIDSSTMIRDGKYYNDVSQSQPWELLLSR